MTHLRNIARSSGVRMVVANQSVNQTACTRANHRGIGEAEHDQSRDDGLAAAQEDRGSDRSVARGSLIRMRPSPAILHSLAAMITPAGALAGSCVTAAADRPLTAFRSSRGRRSGVRRGKPTLQCAAGERGDRDRHACCHSFPGESVRVERAQAERARRQHRENARKRTDDERMPPSEPPKHDSREQLREREHRRRPQAQRVAPVGRDAYMRSRMDEREAREQYGGCADDQGHGMQ